MTESKPKIINEVGEASTRFSELEQLLRYEANKSKATGGHWSSDRKIYYDAPTVSAETIQAYVMLRAARGESHSESICSGALTGALATKNWEHTKQPLIVSTHGKPSEGLLSMMERGVATIVDSPGDYHGRGAGSFEGNVELTIIKCPGDGHGFGAGRSRGNASISIYDSPGNHHGKSIGMDEGRAKMRIERSPGNNHLCLAGRLMGLAQAVLIDSPGDNHAFGAGRDGGNATIVFIDSPGAGERAHCAGYDGGAATVSTYCSSLGIY